jgi:RimJ/RimL family protein N-acetyltransferase
MVQPVLPQGGYDAAARALRGCAIAGFVGPRGAVRGVEAALTLGPLTRVKDEDEPHFLLDLHTLTVPDGPGRIVPMADAPHDTLLAWFLDYEVSVLNTPPDQARIRAETNLRKGCVEARAVVLMENGTPLAMTGFNAQRPGIVQVGGVYTPPALRGRHHARRAVALHLAQARDRGVEQAVLFSASDSASRAYRAIGFDRIGDWTLILLANTVQVR